MKIKKANFRAGELSAGQGAEDSRSFNITFMTDAVCDCIAGYPEICVCEKEAVNLSRFERGVMPLLFNHNRDAVIGRVDEVEVKDGKARATIVLDEDEQSDVILNKIRSGSLRGISVGYWRDHIFRYEKGMSWNGVEFDETTLVTDKWTPFEISVVSCPADENCGFTDRGANGEQTIEVEVKGEKSMEKNDKKPDVVDQKIKPAEPTPAGERSITETDVADAVKRGAAEEQQRVTGIMAVCRQFDVDPDKFIKDPAFTVDKTRAAVLDVLAERQKKVNTNMKIEIGETDREKFVKRAADGMALRFGAISAKDATEGAESFRNMSLRSLAEECLGSDGYGEISPKELRRMSPTELFDKMFGHTRAMGTEQFVSIIDGFGNKVLLKAYNEQESIYQNFVTVGSNPDFRPTHEYRVGVDGEPELMPAESAEFKYQSMSDEVVTTGIKTYGKAIAFTREIFINDDLGVVERAIAAQSAGFRRFKEKMFFNTLLTVPFSKAKGNLVQTNKDISAKAYSEMTRLMLHQMDSEGKAYIGVIPKLLLAPSDDNTILHEQLLTSTADPAGANSGVANVARGKMALFTTPYLTGTAYYAIARPSEMEGIRLSTLNGVDTPYSRVVEPQGHLGIDIQMWSDFGFNLIDYRAFVKNPMTD